MNTASLARQQAVRLDSSHATQARNQFIGDQKTYVKTQKILLWFALSAGTIFVATGIYIF